MNISLINIVHLIKNTLRKLTHYKTSAVECWNVPFSQRVGPSDVLTVQTGAPVRFDINIIQMGADSQWVQISWQPIHF